MNNNGVRIQKVLSDRGILSRRKAEEAIRQGRVTVNGRPCSIGQQIDPRKDLIAVDGTNVPFQKHKRNAYIMLHKPRGYVTTTSDEMGRKCVTDLLEDAPVKVYPVGRLDKNSEGLLLLTNDGEFANTIMHPRNHISKTYRVTVRPDVTEEQALQLSTGVEIDGRLTSPATVHVVTREQGRGVLQITIYEGRNRQVRKMCEAVGLTVARLRRTSVGPLKLGMLAPGKWRELTPAELAALRGSMQKAESRARHEADRERGNARRAGMNRGTENAPGTGSARKPGGGPKQNHQRRGNGPSKPGNTRKPNNPKRGTAGGGAKRGHAGD